MKADAHLRQVEAAIKDAIVAFHPDADFVGIRVEPRTSWCGSDMIEIWAVYDGDANDLAVPAKHTFAPAFRTSCGIWASMHSRTCTSSPKPTPRI